MKIKQLRVPPEAPRWYPRWHCGARIKAGNWPGAGWCDCTHTTRAEARSCPNRRGEWADADD